MSWFTKISSINFSVKDSHKISQPKTLHYIAADMWRWAAKNVPPHFKPSIPEWVAMDGFATDSTTGVINWYFPQNIEYNQIEPYINWCVNEELSPLGITVGYMNSDKSKMFDVNVVRIHITKNDTAELKQLPSMNLSNTNALILQQVLGLTPDFSGSIQAGDLKNRIQQARASMDDWDLNDNTGYSNDIAEAFKGFNIVNSPLEPDRIIFYLDQLGKIADFALQDYEQNKKLGKPVSPGMLEIEWA